MKKLYSKFAESRVKHYMATHAAEAPTSPFADRPLRLVRAENIFWQPISAKPPTAVSRWVE